MTPIDYFSSEVTRQLEILRRSYDDLYERASKLAALLLAGGGAVGTYALSEFGKDPSNMLGWAPLAGLSVVWFATAGMLLLRGSTTHLIPSGINVASLQARFEYEHQRGNSEADAMGETRRAALDVAKDQVLQFTAGCNARSDAIDDAYRSAAVLSPIVPTMVAVAVLWFSR